MRRFYVTRVLLKGRFKRSRISVLLTNQIKNINILNLCNVLKSLNVGGNVILTRVLPIGNLNSFMKKVVSILSLIFKDFLENHF